MTMLANFDFDVIRRALPYLFFEGMPGMRAAPPQAETEPLIDIRVGG